MNDPPKKTAEIPSWQRSPPSSDETPAAHPHGSDPSTQSSHAELLEQARHFLKDEAVRNESHDRKVAFLQQKGLQADDIEKLLAEEQQPELKTVYDSNDNTTSIHTSSTETSNSKIYEQSQPSLSRPSSPLLSSSSSAPPPQQRDMPPVITYPEFLLKPQKPPPLITFSRLANATYAFAGLATLTYGASKYIVEPMVTTLTEARHSLASSALTDLETLNQKLESNVSHVPYIASAAALKHTRNHSHDTTTSSDDTSSITSDPTELFHRDTATQTTPSLSRRASSSNTTSNRDTHLDATTTQTLRLKELHTTLSSLLSALDPKEVPYLPPPPGKKLHETIADFQSVLDKLETTYNPFRGDYYSTIYAVPSDNTGKRNKEGVDVAAKVRSEIRNLKGAFLNARNFPSAPRPVGLPGSTR